MQLTFYLELVGIYKIVPVCISVGITTCVSNGNMSQVYPDRILNNICKCTYKNPMYGDILGKGNSQKSDLLNFWV